MRFRTREPLINVLLSTGLHLIDSLRDRLPDDVDDIKDRVRDTYDTASHRISRATGALRGEEESHIFKTVGALVIGVGIGMGIGLLIAPTSGEETRADIADKVSDFGDTVRERTGKKPQAATGTYGE
jgi:YtxH-like protein